MRHQRYEANRKNLVTLIINILKNFYLGRYVVPEKISLASYKNIRCQTRMTA